MDELESRVQTGYTVQKLGRGEGRGLRQGYKGSREEGGWATGCSLCKCPEAGMCWCRQ